MLTDDVGIGDELQHTREWPRASAQGANKSMKRRILPFSLTDILLVEFANCEVSLSYNVTKCVARTCVRVDESSKEKAIRVTGKFYVVRRVRRDHVCFRRL